MARYDSNKTCNITIVVPQTPHINHQIDTSSNNDTLRLH